jgi:hypothetical protein
MILYFVFGSADRTEIWRWMSVLVQSNDVNNSTDEVI